MTNSGITFPTGVCVTAKIRVDTWTNGDGYCFAGIGLMNDPATGEGYDLVFTAGSPNTVAFLYDDFMWGNTCTFNWTAGTWYWFKEAYDASTSTVYGKVWADGTPEPTDWMLTQPGWAPLANTYPCINGGGHGCAMDAGDFSVTAYSAQAQLGGTSFTLSDVNADHSVLVTFSSIPVANDDAYTIPAGQGLDVSAANGVLANDTNADGNPLTAQLVNGPADGMFYLNADGSFYYAPNGGFYGTDTFTYVAVNGGVSSTIATVTINVVPIETNNASYATPEGQTLTVNATALGAWLDIDVFVPSNTDALDQANCLADPFWDYPNFYIDDWFEGDVTLAEVQTVQSWGDNTIIAWQVNVDADAQAFADANGIQIITGTSLGELWNTLAPGL